MNKQVSRKAAAEASEPPVGPLVDPPPPGHVPDGRILFGRWTRLEPVSMQRHARDLWTAIADGDAQSRIWTYMGYGPFENFETFRDWLKAREESRDPWFYAFIPRSAGKAAGMGAFMRADRANGVIEIGHIWMVPALQRTREATDAIFLMMRHCFDDLGVRRLEWKCDALNAPSRRAAERFGFTFEGIFRQHMIVKGRNRDTAWYAMLDHEWPKVHNIFKAWLAEANFDAGAKQKAPLRIK
jgi:RimJ/RimL family protein N-acetyltransferase